MQGVDEREMYGFVATAQVHAGKWDRVDEQMEAILVRWMLL